MDFALALPCRADEPGLDATLERAWRAWPAAARDAVRVSICLNGVAGAGGAESAVEFWAARHHLPLRTDDLDAGGAAANATSGVRILRTRRPGKANAWNHLRRLTATPAVVFMDADVEFEPDTFSRLLATLAAHPEAAIASARTQADARPTRFEQMQAMPYRLPFRNLSPQLYAARLARLPPAMPDDLLEPERWLELIVGADRVVHAPGAVVRVRLPATLPDFFHQRIRIELAKVQLQRDYPGLGGRAAASPGGRSALRTLSGAELVQLAGYLGLRSVAHAVAWWRYVTGAMDVAWRQAGSTKDWTT